jgi:glutamyl-tRNA reductase
MNLTVFSISYESASIDCLEKVSANKDEVTHYLNTLMGGVFFNELVVISTCNRTEWVFISVDSKKATSVLIDCIKLKTNISTSILNKISVTYEDDAALIHLFELAAGLKSMVLGESEILSQIKMSHSFCMEFGSTSALLNKLFQMVVALGKEVRTKTKISAGAHSISSIAIEAVKEDPDFLNSPILLIGAGVMIHRAIAKLTAMGHKSMAVTNRTMSRAEQLTDSFGQIEVIPYASIRKQLHRFSLIYVAISSKNYVIRTDDLRHLKGKKTVIDLGIPRNIEPSCSDLSHVKLISIAELESVSKRTMSQRLAEIPVVKQMIQVDMDEFRRWEAYRNQSVDQWIRTRQFA